MSTTARILSASMKNGFRIRFSFRTATSNPATRLGWLRSALSFPRTSLTSRTNCESPLHANPQAPAAMERLAEQIRGADGFVFVTGEYNWGVQPGLKNLTDHFLEEWFWRPAAIASYSAGRLSGARSNSAWHATLSEMGMVVISSTLTVGPIGQTLDGEAQPTGPAGQSLDRAFGKFADDLAWWTEAAREQRERRAPPY